MTEPTLPTGLAEDQARARLLRDGPNALPGGGRRSLLGVVAGVLREPMLLLLVAASAIYLVLGDFHEAVILSIFAGLTVVIAVVQEARTERAIDALRDLSSPQATVIREGQRRTIRSAEVVCGDLLVLSEGSRVAADGWLVEADALQADEAMLTGESVPVAKIALEDERPLDAPLPGGEHVPYAWSGTLVVRGSGLMEVAATGGATRIGAIGQSLASLGSELPRLAVQTRGLVRWFAVGAMVLSAIAVVLYGLTRGNWLDGLLSGIAIAMSLLPEELPVVLTLFMTMGALRMSRSRVLARRGTAIETLGAATVLCTDKTGTLTQNRMAVAELRLPDGGVFEPGANGAAFPEAFQTLARTGILACPQEPFDPMEKAFHALHADHPAARLGNHVEDGWALHHHFPLDTSLLAMTQVWARDGYAGMLVAAKGAPEAIADLCHLSPPERDALEAGVAAMAARGLRVLGVAQARWESPADLPESQHDFAFTFAGLVGLADPIRETVPAAVATLQEAGIRVVMVTGDYPVTAEAIAGKAGIAPGEVLSGTDLERLTDTDLAARIGKVSVFARVMPEQKLRIVRALKAAGEVVAMTGDGVNDAPSLKAADIGIAMGQRGTDVAREASALVLLDDDFGAIPTAVRLGRRIYDNIRKATVFIFAVHIPIGGLALAPLLAGWPLILGPIQIALLEMVIDPVCSLSFEAEQEEADIMRRAPRDPDAALVSRGLVRRSLLQGTLAFGLLLALAAWAQGAGLDASHYRATVFAGLIASVLVIVFANRSLSGGASGRRKGHNRTFAVILAAAVLFFSLLFLFPPVAGMLHSAVLEVPSLTAVGIVTATLWALLVFHRRRFAR